MIRYGLTVGRTVGEAFGLMYNLEQACRIQLAAMAGRRPPTFPSEEICERTTAQFDADPDGAADLEWQALRRIAPPPKSVSGQCIAVLTAAG